MNKRCETCMYWRVSDAKPINVYVHEDARDCRRNPPLDSFGRWPTTRPTDWCGEWKPKQAAEPKRGRPKGSKNKAKCDGPDPQRQVQS